MLDPQFLFTLLQNQGNDQPSTVKILLSFDQGNHRVYTDSVSAAQFVSSPLWGIKLFTRKLNVINSIKPKIQDQVGI